MKEIEKHDIVLNVVSDTFKIPIDTIIGKSRIAEIVQARRFAMYYIYHTLKYSLKKTGEIIGGRDHSTIIHNNAELSIDIMKNNSIGKSYHRFYEKVSMVLFDEKLDVPHSQSQLDAYYEMLEKKIIEAKNEYKKYIKSKLKQFKGKVIQDQIIKMIIE